MLNKNINKMYWSDQKRVKQVLINLISNFYKITERRGIKIKIKDRKRWWKIFEIWSKWHRSWNQQRSHPKTLEMFGMLSKYRNKLNQSGSGLGLSISKRIVQSLGGRIKASSNENEWSKFTFTIRNVVETKKI